MIKVKIVGVQFEDYDKVYYYKTFIDVKVGDMVVVEAKCSYSIAKVVSICGDSTKASKYIVSKIDIEAHKENRAKVEEQEKLMKELDRRIAEINKMQFYKQFAETDDEIKGLLDAVENFYL